MNLAQIIRLFCYGTSEGAVKGWEHRRRAEGETHEQKFHVVREGNPGISWSGTQKTGVREAHNALSKLEYFAKTRGFNQIGTERTGGQTGYYAGKMMVAHYLHPTGATLTTYHDTALGRVTASLHGPPDAHTDLDKTMARKDLNKMQYELAQREWMTDPRRKELIG